MPDLARAIVISIGILVLASTAVYGFTGFAFLTTTLQLAAVAVILTAKWDRFGMSSQGPVPSAVESHARGTAMIALIAAALAGVLIFLACRAWIGALATHPVDARGGAAPAFARALHIDHRLIWLVGQLFFPIACGIVAVGVASEGRIASEIGWLLLLATAALAPDLRAIASIPSTPVFWPILAAVVWSASRMRNPRAALVYGLAAATLVLFVGHHAVTSHEPDPRDVVGTAGLLLRVGGGSLVPVIHVAALALVLVLAWRAVSTGRRPLTWIALVLFVAEMTTPAPFEGVPLDASMLFTFAAIAETDWLKGRRASMLWLASVAVSMFLVAAVTRTTLADEISIDVGGPQARSALYSGFADDEGDDRTFAWVDGRQAEILLPRRSSKAAVIEIVCQPNLPTEHSTQQMSVGLNSVVLGTVGLHFGWQTVSLDAPSRAWQIGANVLTLSLSSAVSPLESGLSGDPRKLSVALDRITVRSRP